MSRVLLGEVAVERKETCKENRAGYPSVGLEHLVPEEVSLTQWDEGKENTFTKMFRKGDVLFGRRRAYLKKASVADFDGICSGDITVISAKPDRIVPELLPFVIQNDAMFEFAVGKSAGSLSPRVKWNHMKDFEFELPDMDRQRQLADVLWAMEDTKRNYRRLISATDDLVKSQFIEMFGKTKKVPLHHLAIIIMGQSPSSDSYNSIGKGVPFYQGSGDFTEKYVKTRLFCTMPTRMAQSGDVLLSVRAPVGAVNLTEKDCCIGRGLSAIRSKMSIDYNEYFYYAFRVMEHELCSLGYGSTVSAINKKQLFDVQIPDAPLPDQIRFIQFARESDKSKFAA